MQVCCMSQMSACQNFREMTHSFGIFLSRIVSDCGPLSLVQASPLEYEEFFMSMEKHAPETTVNTRK